MPLLFFFEILLLEWLKCYSLSDPNTTPWIPIHWMDPILFRHLFQYWFLIGSNVFLEWFQFFFPWTVPKLFLDLFQCCSLIFPLLLVPLLNFIPNWFLELFQCCSLISCNVFLVWFQSFFYSSWLVSMLFFDGFQCFYWIFCNAIAWIVTRLFFDCFQY